MRDGERHLRPAQQVMEALFGGSEERAFDVRYWDGTLERGQRDTRFTIVINSPGALRAMLLPPSELSMAEALISGDIEIEGDLEEASALGDRIAHRLRSTRTAATLLPLLLRLPRQPRASTEPLRFVRRSHRADNRRGGRAAIRHHYDVGNAFYSLWLDPEMQYSCAYFRKADETLEQAQLDKLELICRKLRLQPGERLLDIGCGWGGLIRYAATRYGVVADGVTLSTAQAEYAAARIAREGLSALCRVHVQDYRDLGSAAEYDKIVSVGMMEHVAADAQPAYFAAAHRALKPGGLFLNHCQASVQRARPRTMAQRVGDRIWQRNEFIDRYVFPEGRLVPAAHIISSAEQAGFELRDVESLREHYALTLRHWVRRLETQRDEAIRVVGERTFRVWRLYMSAAAHGFASGRINIVQTLLARPDAAGRAKLPLTREDVYATDGGVASSRRLPAA